MFELTIGRDPKRVRTHGGTNELPRRVICRWQATSALWPNESFDGGSHIGLMQVPSTLQRAWDWHTNTSDGASLFSQKISIARSLENHIRQANHGLRHLTRVELENMALVLYGPYANANLGMQYYAPQTVNGNIDWVVNTAGNPGGVNYANMCRASVK